MPLSLSSLQTFVYLFAPICGHIRESDFMQNTRLENGRRVWQALWEFRHPDIECFTAQVRIASRCQWTLASHQGPLVQGARRKPLRRKVLGVMFWDVAWPKG